MNKLKLLLTIATLFTAVHATYAHDFTVDGIYYNILSNTTVEVTFRGEHEYADYYSGDIVIPETVNSYTVVAIGDNAFYQCDKVTSVIIPNTVTNIGFQAFFGCSGLTSLIIPNSVTTIGNSSFPYCENLRDLTLSNSLIEIPQWAFGYCIGLTNVVIPDSVAKIGQNAFYMCTDLETLTLGCSVNSIEQNAFVGCFEITAITSLNPTPPIVNSAFNTSALSIYYKPLYVPEECIGTYQIADFWKYFKAIQAISGIESINVNTNEANVAVTDGHIIITDNGEMQTVKIYDLSGRQIYYGSDTTIPIADKGIYIVRVGNSTRKIAIN